MYIVLYYVYYVVYIILCILILCILYCVSKTLTFIILKCLQKKCTPLGWTAPHYTVYITVCILYSVYSVYYTAYITLCIIYYPLCMSPYILFTLTVMVGVMVWCTNKLLFRRGNISCSNIHHWNKENIHFWKYHGEISFYTTEISWNTHGYLMELSWKIISG